MTFRSLLPLTFLALQCCGPAPGWAETPVLYDGFEGTGSGCAVSTDWGEALTVDADHYTPNTAETRFVSSPAKAGVCAGNYYALTGTNEKTPFQIGFTDLPSNNLSSVFGEEPSEICFTWNLYVETDYPYASSSQKMVRFFYQDAAHPESRKEVNFQPSTAAGFMSISAFCGATFGVSHEGSCAVDFGETDDEATPEGQWVEYRGYIKLNTPGQSDGVLRLQRDGVTILEEVNMSNRGNDTRGFNGMWIGGNYSVSGGGNLAASGSIYYDEISMCRTCPCKVPRKGSNQAKKKAAAPAVFSGVGIIPLR